MTTIEKRTYSVPTREEVSSHNQGLFENLQKNLGFVPNLYAYFAKKRISIG